MTLINTPDTALDKISMDIMGPLPTTQSNNSYPHNPGPPNQILLGYIPPASRRDSGSRHVYQRTYLYVRRAEGNPHQPRIALYKQSNVRDSTKI